MHRIQLNLTVRTKNPHDWISSSIASRVFGKPQCRFWWECVCLRLRAFRCVSNKLSPKTMQTTPRQAKNGQQYHQLASEWAKTLDIKLLLFFLLFFTPLRLRSSWSCAFWLWRLLSTTLYYFFVCLCCWLAMFFACFVWFNGKISMHHLMGNEHKKSKCVQSVEKLTFFSRQAAAAAIHIICVVMKPLLSSFYNVVSTQKHSTHCFLLSIYV